jgi:NADH-quinone oxidoreductase subunit A
MINPLDAYLPILVVLGVAGAMAFLIPQLTTRLGPKSVNEIKSAAFECGNEPIGSARQRFAVKF